LLLVYVPRFVAWSRKAATAVSALTCVEAYCVASEVSVHITSNLLKAIECLQVDPGAVQPECWEQKSRIVATVETATRATANGRLAVSTLFETIAASASDLGLARSLCLSVSPRSEVGGDLTALLVCVAT
jgi:hypothetical protein